MKSLSFKISNRDNFQKQLVNCFKDSKNLFFLNSNNDKENLIAISNTDEVIADNWKFGFVSYDYKNKIEKLTSDNFDGIDFPESAFFTPTLLFNLSPQSVEVHYNKLFYSEKDVLKIVKETERIEIQKFNFSIELKARVSKTDYIKNVKKLKEHIQKGDVYEVNYCQEFYATNVDVSPIDLYFKLNDKSPTPFSCFVKHNNRYLLSASPERFIKKTDSNIISQPIKGTIKRGKNAKEDEQLKRDLFHDQKERSENIMIVDLVRNDLSKIAKKNSVEVDELCEIYTFPQVHQMISTVRGDLDHNVDFEAILKATFPMGSMTGAPKVRAMKLIEKYEVSKRGLYSGTIGYIDSSGNFDFNVVIRSILYNQPEKYLSFFVGGAITSLSDPEKEYEECLLKAKAMFEVLC